MSPQASLTWEIPARLPHNPNRNTLSAFSTSSPQNQIIFQLWETILHFRISHFSPKSYFAREKYWFPRSLEKYKVSKRTRVLGTMFSRKGWWDLLDRRHLAGYYFRMLGLVSRQAPRLLRQPGSLIFRRCFADGAPAVALTFGSPSEVSLAIRLIREIFTV